MDAETSAPEQVEHPRETHEEQPQDVVVVSTSDASDTQDVETNDVENTDDGQKQAEVVTNDGAQGVERLTREDVVQVVDDAVRDLRGYEDTKYERLSGDVAALGKSVELLASSGDGEQAEPEEGVTYLVKLEPHQVQVAKSCARVVCTEGLLLVILLALSCGLQAWNTLSDRWRHG